MMNVSLEAGIGWSGRPTFLCGSIMRLREVLLSYLSILLLCLSPASVWYSSHSVYCLLLIFWHLRQSYLLSSTSCQWIDLVRFAGGLDGITISSIVDCSPWEFSGSHRLISWTEFRAWLVDWNFLVVEESFFFSFAILSGVSSGLHLLCHSYVLFYFVTRSRGLERRRFLFQHPAHIASRRAVIASFTNVLFLC